MRRFRLLLHHPLAGPLMRFALAGATVALVFLGGPVLLDGALGLPIEVAIPICYLAAISLHFTLQRKFVFRHVAQFALSRREQIGRYAMIAAIQYPTTALATAFVPGLLGWSSRVVYVLVAGTVSLSVFVLLRTRVFHPARATSIAS